jgi:hypothetical protein
MEDPLIEYASASARGGEDLRSLAYASGLPVERLAQLRRRVVDSNGLDREAVEELGALREELRALKPPFAREGLSPTQARARLMRRRYPPEPVNPRQASLALRAKRHAPGEPINPRRASMELRARRATWIERER